MSLLAEEISKSIFALAGSIGRLSSNVGAIQPCMIIEVFDRIFSLAADLDIDIVTAVQEKVEINKLKYPKELCQKETTIKKYTNYSGVTGIAKDAELSLSTGLQSWSQLPISVEVVRVRFQHHLPQLLQAATDCSRERGWLGNYSQQSLVCSLFCEMAELMELIQWKDTSKLKTYSGLRDGLTRELADVTIYCIHFLRELGLTTLPVKE
jgi:NTP pyrophosphatase (non-canonical NTP hydrolase)